MERQESSATESSAPACTLCGAAPATPLFHKRRIPYYACAACDFVFSRPATNANFENAIEDFEPSYLDYLQGSVEDDPNHAALLRWAESFAHLSGEPVLDIGAGSGKLVRFLRGRGARASGIEPAAPVYARFLSEEPFFSAKTVEELSEDPPEIFSVVFACDVLEHVPDPESFLAAISRLLAPGGVLLVSTPDVGSAFARLCGRQWHYYNKYHVSYFSRATLAATAARQGFRELGFTRLSRSKSIGYLLQYFIDFVTGGGRAKLPERLRRMVVPINLYDTMYVAFQRDEAQIQDERAAV